MAFGEHPACLSTAQACQGLLRVIFDAAVRSGGRGAGIAVVGPILLSVPGSAKCMAARLQSADSSRRELRDEGIGFNELTRRSGPSGWRLGRAWGGANGRAATATFSFASADLRSSPAGTEPVAGIGAVSKATNHLPTCSSWRSVFRRSAMSLPPMQSVCAAARVAFSATTFRRGRLVHRLP